VKTISQPHRTKGRARALSVVAALLSVPVTAGALALTAAAPAAAVTIANPTDPNFCANYGQSSNGAYAGVKACNGPYVGTVKFLGANGAAITSDTVGFQCVELVTRYLYAAKGWAVQFADGADIARVYGAANGVSPVLSGNAAGLKPHVGDVISFSVTSNFTDSGHVYPGHVAIVTSVGATSVQILSENWGGGAAYSTLAMSGTTIAAITTSNSSGTMVRTPYIEWLPLSGATPPPPPPPPPPAYYGPFTVVGTGSNGLNERSAPTTSAPIVGHQVNGAPVYVLCQVLGGTYSTGGSPATEAIWDRLTNGTYVADYWLTTPAVGTFSPGIARC
jgi:hypothetical protein